MTARTLSVVIPAYNAAGSIGGTIEALATALDRAPSLDAEVVLVDDGSTDATAAIATAAAEGRRVPLRVVSQANHGRFAARRAGLAAAMGDWVLLLDSRITLHEDALRFVAQRLDEGERVWNGHVYVRTEGNPYGAFWKVVVEVAWRDYLGNPRTTSFGTADFDRYPKGTGCFLAPRALLVESMERFTSHYVDLSAVSDDTAVIRWIAEREPIHLSPGFACDYEARSNLVSFFRQGVYRGTTFVDGHLRRESRFFPGAVAFFPLSILLALAVVRRPAVLPTTALAGGVAAGVAAAAVRCTTYEVRSVSWLAPVYAVAHGAGMWRGLARLARARVGGSR
jgi:glycosyltransferase involved in cell wall biosynthesis